MSVECFAGVRSHVAFFIVTMDSLTYVRIRIQSAFENMPLRYFFHSFHLDKETMEYALPMVRFLLNSPRIAFLSGNIG